MQNAESVSLKKDHIGIAKFDDADDWDFQTVASYLSEMAEVAPSKVEENWEQYKQHEGVWTSYKTRAALMFCVYHVELDLSLRTGKMIGGAGNPILGVQVSETRKSVLGEEHPSTLASMENLTSTHQNQGWWKEAEQLYVQVLETRKRILREEHPDALMSMANLTLTYLNQGWWKEAEQLQV